MIEEKRFMWRQIYYRSLVRLWMNASKKTAKELPSFRYYRNEDNMKKGRFCCSEWKFAKWFYVAPVESSSRILCKHPGTEKPQHESKSWNQQLLILPALRVFLSQLSRCHVCTFLWLLGVFAISVSGGAPVLPHYSPPLLLLCLFPFMLLYCFYSLSTLQSHLAHPLLFYKTSFLSPIKCASKTSTITRTKKLQLFF